MVLLQLVLLASWGVALSGAGGTLFFFGGIMKMLKNPFIPNTISHRFYDAVRNASEPVRVRDYFNRIGVKSVSAIMLSVIANHSDEFYQNLTVGRSGLRVNDVITMKSPSAINHAYYNKQVANTQQYQQSMQLMRSAK